MAVIILQRRQKYGDPTNGHAKINLNIIVEKHASVGNLYSL
jgi:hypothetical protein